MGRLYIVPEATPQGANPNKIGSMSRWLRVRPDIPSVHAIQGDPPQGYCGETAVAVSQSRSADRSTPEGPGRVRAHMRGSGGT